MYSSENKTMRTVVGIGELCAKSGKAEMVTIALGSCIALCLYDPSTGVGAMAHILLPSSRSIYGRGGDGTDTSTKYADKALNVALEKMYALGARKKSIRAGIVGGAEMFPLGGKGAGNIGALNIASVTEELKKSRIPLDYTSTGGTKARTVTFIIPGKAFDEQLSIKSPSAPRYYFAAE